MSFGLANMSKKITLFFPKSLSPFAMEGWSVTMP